MLLTQVFSRRFGMDCRNPVGMEGNHHSPPPAFPAGMTAVSTALELGARRWLTIGTGWQARIDKLTSVSHWPVWTHVRCG